MGPCVCVCLFVLIINCFTTRYTQIKVYSYRVFMKWTQGCSPSYQLLLFGHWGACSSPTTWQIFWGPEHCPGSCPYPWQVVHLRRSRCGCSPKGALPGAWDCSPTARALPLLLSTWNSGLRAPSSDNREAVASTLHTDDPSTKVDG